MIAHIVLFKPKPDITAAQREAMFAALTTAAADIPYVQRFQIGSRITHGRAYEQLMREDYPYAAIIEFADVVGLRAYLNHPNHERLGGLFFELLESGLIYDYEMKDPADIWSLNQ